MEDIHVYVNKDGRTRAYQPDTQQVVSYPRLLMEEKLQRKLLPYEQVHHIDGNPQNNDLDNLEIQLLGPHQAQHHPRKYFDKQMICPYCCQEFTWTVRQQKQYYKNRKRRGVNSPNAPFCSKQCGGQYGRDIQYHNESCGSGAAG